MGEGTNKGYKIETLFFLFFSVVAVIFHFVLCLFAVGSSVFCIVVYLLYFDANIQLYFDPTNFFFIFFVVLELKRCFIVFWKCNFFSFGIVLMCIFVLFLCVFFRFFGHKKSGIL